MFIFSFATLIQAQNYFCFFLNETEKTCREQIQMKIKHTQSRVKQTIKQMYMTKRNGYLIYRYTTVHARFPLVFSGVPVTRSLVLCIYCVYRCLSFCTVSFCHCVVCSSIYGLWLPLWYLQTLIMQCLSYMI